MNDHPAAFRPDPPAHNASTGEIVPVSALVAPVAPVTEIVAKLDRLEETCKAILRPGDWQDAGDGRFVVKSGWRRLAFAFGLDDEVLDRVVEQADGRITRVTTIVRAVAANGRGSTGVGIASLTERCCAVGCRKRHQHCRHDCDGARHWTVADHSISATSFTRALSRAISDLIGGGPDDDLAEEDDGEWDGGHDPGPRPGPVAQRAQRPSGPDPVTLGAQELQRRIAELDDDQVTEFDRLAIERHLPLSPPTRAGLSAAAQILDDLEGSR